MIAALPMYDMATASASNDRLWSLIRDELGRGPDHLTRGTDLWEIWESPALLFAQTCGMPFRTRLFDKVGLIGTPIYDIQANPGFYYSVIITRKDGPDTLNSCLNRTFAFNERLSQSGWAAPMVLAEKRGVTFGKFHQTGAHRASIQAVLDGVADLAAIDVVTWEMLRQSGDDLSALKVIEHTPQTPALPFITARGEKCDALFDATARAIARLAPPDRATLRLKGITKIAPEAYLNVPNPATN